MRNKINPFFGGLMVVNRGGKAGRRSPRRKRYAGDPPALPSAKVNGIDSFVQQQGQAALINTGRRSYHNTETPLHQNSISLKIKNNNVTNRADLVLTAGYRKDLTSLAAQTITDGSQDTTNDNGQLVNVTVECEFGVDGTVQGWERVKGFIERDGLIIGSTRLEYTKDAQKRYKYRIDRDDMFGDNVLDHIFPEVYYDPNQYHQNMVQSDVQYQLTNREVVKYSIAPDTEVVITLWVTGRLEMERFLMEFMRRQGQNSLL